MGSVRALLNRIFGGKKAPNELSVEDLRIAFKARYHRFKRLLDANNKVLDVMAEMEEALRGTQPFGMAFVRERCTRVATDVFQVITHLNELAPGKYERLFETFTEIRGKMEPFLLRTSAVKPGPLVIPLSEVNRDLAGQVGSKIANLGEIGNRVRLRVPDGFAITARAYQRFMEHNDLQPEIDRLIQAAEREQLDQRYALSAAIQRLIVAAALPGDLQQAIMEQYHRLEEKEGRGVAVAMRSSALLEDVAGASFAGQYLSELNVREDRIVHVYKQIVASKYSPPAMSYRLNRGIRDIDVAMCVGCLRMVDAAVGGVLYSRNPVDIRDDAVVINSAWGLTKSVAEGSEAADSFVVGRGEPLSILHADIAVKGRKFVCDAAEGVRLEELSGEEGRKSSLSREQVLEFARRAIAIEEYYRAPQDIEWAIAKDGAVEILQCRPLHQLATAKQSDAGAGRGGSLGPVIVSGGVTASPGAAAGNVFAVRRDEDALGFPDGAVLLAAQALPRWAVLLSRAAAVVTEQGNMTGHLANVAREFGVPALFGIEHALSRLEQGQAITVDADGRNIFAGRIDRLLKAATQPKNLMAGSPVHEALEGAAEHIVPLNLLDPDAHSFRPESCRTFHDITRFCHEKSVSEMFRFGKDHSFPERSSKQLVAEIPMKWWVLNLDDGFREEVVGKYVRLENIVSIPMLALWEGITRFPWEGPPPIDAKGFMSVMFQATTNPALVPGAHSSYTDRNYFMISRDYCSLTSRLGFHFSTVETLMSDRSKQNYISFHFKGGAADFERRLKRILFVADILEERGFRVSIREDNLVARAEDLNRDSMEEHLKMIGYLTIHTRQLDMIMADEASVGHYRSKMDREIEQLLGASEAAAHGANGEAEPAS